ncbi:MAG TPA: DUF2231 domain-containing protein [Nocardioidaceae bacterium]|nr:DUF2231 domain-containing protein [Nocardioidaceae bacterium]
MFDDFFGLPFHPFIVHATLVVLPGVASLAIAYIALPSWRWLMRWPLVLAAVATPVLTWVTVQAGESLKDQLGLPDEVIGTHEDRAETLLLITVAFGVLALVAAFTMGGPSLLISGAGSRRSAARPVQIGIGVLLAVAAVGVIVMVILTGDEGSRVVWSDVPG